MKSPQSRAKAETLLSHRWLAQITEPKLQKKISLDITENLQEFRVSHTHAFTIPIVVLGLPVGRDGFHCKHEGHRCRARIDA